MTMKYFEVKQNKKWINFTYPWLPFHKDQVLLEERQGRWQWYWVIGSSVLAIVSLVLFSLILSQAAIFFSQYRGDIEKLGEAYKAVKNFTLFIPGNFYTNIYFIIFALSLMTGPILLLRLHRGSWTIFTYNTKFYFQPFFKAGGAWAFALAIIVLGCILFDSSNLTMRKNWLELWPWVVLGLITLLIQTLGEEIMFRGYLTRLWGAIIPYRIIIVSIWISLFTFLHAGNPDVKSDLKFMIFYFVIVEILMYWILFRTRTVMATWGIHWVNNSAALFFALQHGWGNQLSLFTYKDPVIAAGGSHLLNPIMYTQILVMIALFIGLVVWKKSPFYLEKK